MVCDIVDCPLGHGLVVWVEVDEIMSIDQRAILRQRMQPDEAAAISAHKQLNWAAFPAAERERR
jgi:hypothetical protein